nr:ABC transporter family substrate-binding protein [Rhodococcus sp. HNM0569]
MVGGLATLVALLLLTACTADPPPPVESTETPEPIVPTTEREPFVVAIDDVGNGFNPHLLADQSPANAAVSSLVLPSPFRTAPVADRPGEVQRVPDPSLLVSAEVTSEAPFTITYRLRTDAQWSDSAPVAAEDFRYLWQEMISKPGVVDPAGYRLIDDVRSSGGGKTVTVVMKSPYPAWRELFSDLLPSHLIKDSPGGFETGLMDGIPVSGSWFHVKSIDRGRDEILLERNDRFWGTPAVPSQILLRRAGTPSQLADSMRTGDAQVAVTRGGAPTSAQLAAIPDVRTGQTFQPRMMELMLNGRVPALADIRVRRALLAFLDTDLLAAVGAGGDAAQARSLVFAPSDPAYAPSAPPRPTRDDALALLAEAGYVLGDTSSGDADAGSATTTASTPTGTATPKREPEPTRTQLVRGDETLRFTIGVPIGDEVAAAVANTAVDQLRGAGVDASVEAVEAEELYSEALTDESVDAVVGWNRAGGDPATAVASRFACIPEAAARDEATPSDGATPSRTPDPDDPETTDTVAPDETSEDLDAERDAPSNLSGLCDPTVQPALTAALRGDGDVTATLRDLDARLWGLATVAPLFQDRTAVAAGPSAGGVTLTGVLPSGVFADAALWERETP